MYHTTDRGGKEDKVEDKGRAQKDKINFEKLFFWEKEDLMYSYHITDHQGHKKITLFRCQRCLAKNANWGHLQDRIGIWMCWFLPFRHATER